jgi:hypothetical protein
VHDAEFLGREVKIEFEPVRRWDEITKSTTRPSASGN